MTRKSKLSPRQCVASGVNRLDSLLNGLTSGDNVLWQDDSGSLASTFSLNFIRSSLALDKPVICVNFDKSPAKLLEMLNPPQPPRSLTILDCFSCGKGADSPLTPKLHHEVADLPCRIVRVDEPRRIDGVLDVLFDTYADLNDDTRLVFESITGMQELWGSEENVIGFCAHSCLRLTELGSTAYWIMRKKAHSPHLRSQVSRTAQIVIDLEIRRGTSSLTIVKALDRDQAILHKPYAYWTKDFSVSFDEANKTTGRLDLGLRLKEFRTRSGLSQTEVARLVGVTPSTISQIENNLIYPSVPALLKIAEVLGVDISSFFDDKSDRRKRVVFPPSEGAAIQPSDFPRGSISMTLFPPLDSDFRAEPCIVEIPPRQVLSSHFFVHKGEELGYLLSGELQVEIDRETYTAAAGDCIYLRSEIPGRWKNNGDIPAKLLWVRVRP